MGSPAARHGGEPASVFKSPLGRGEILTPHIAALPAFAHRHTKLKALQPTRHGEIRRGGVS